ncbi:hypothetical protein [Actinocorallia populi]|uniref:hypothetical protein n=1 Tax=Actinocorallia populi TaxID=2079200 RepID=UPI001300615D|nr:hypothetical protein [Actinocorallia populi]
MGGETEAEAEQLLRFLRDVARSRRVRVPDLAAYDQVHWLAELPSDVRLHPDAGPGEVLFGLPPIPLEAPDSVADAEGFATWLALRRWYRALRGLAEALEAPQDADGREVVLATGLLTWAGGADGRPVQVRNHLLATPLRVALDSRTERVDVLVGQGPAVLQDLDVLGDVPGFQPSRTDWLREAVRAGQGAALHASVSDVLRKWGSSAFAEPVPFREDWADEGGAGDRLRLAPALVLRPRSGTALVELLEGMLTRVRNGPVPSGIARFLQPGPDDRLAHVPDRSAAAGLLCALLSRGRRVLVTTGRPREIRDALPPEVSGLAATFTAAGSDLAEQRRELAARFAAHDPEHDERALAEHQAEAVELDREAAALQARLAAFRQEERLELAPGYRGTREELEAALSPGFPWLPVLPGLPAEPPLTAAEAAELTDLLAASGPGREARSRQRMPDPSVLPAPGRVRLLVAMAQAPAAEPGDLAQRLADRGPEALERLEEYATTVQTVMDSLGIGWGGGDWTARALRDGLAGPAPLWEYLGDLAGRAATADRALRAVGGHWVVLPPGPEGELIEAARELRHHLVSGGTLKRGPLRPAAQKRAELLLEESTVDGGPPRTPEKLDVVIAALESRQAVGELAEAWRSVGVELADSQALDGLVAQLSVLYAKLGQVRTALRAVTETHRLLRRIGLPLVLQTPAAWREYQRALELVRVRQRASTAWAALASLRQTVELEIGEGQAPPELRAAAAALSARDLAAYEQSLEDLARARREQAAQLRCDELLERLRAVHPDLARRPTLVPEEWEEAWRWAHLSSLLLAHPRAREDLELTEELEQARERAREAGDALAHRHAWGWALSRPGGEPPLWIMPPAEAASALPADPDSFDVVVVDQAGEGVEWLLLLWHAPRVMVLGPGGPVPAERTLTPESTFFGTLAARFPVLEVGADGSRRLPPPPPERPEVPAPRSGEEPLEFAPGRSIVAYQRAELVELVRRLAADTTLTDEQLVARARDVLACPPDELHIAEARLRYAVQSLRA